MTRKREKRVWEYGYGAFPGGNPCNFHPDPECSTPEERKAHAAAVKAWRAGKRRRLPSAHQWLPGGVHLSLGMFGLGTYKMLVPARWKR